MRKIPILLAASLIILAVSCTFFKQHGGYGSLGGNSAVGSAFMAGQVNPNLYYYYLGAAAAPYVIIGVRKDLTLDDARDWRTFGPLAPGYLGQVTKMMYDTWRERGYTLQGFRILDQNGRYLGDWFSIWDINIINPVVFSKDAQHIEIYPPPFPRLEPSGAGEGTEENR